MESLRAEGLTGHVDWARSCGWMARACRGCCDCHDVRLSLVSGQPVETLRSSAAGRMTGALERGAGGELTMGCKPRYILAITGVMCCSPVRAAHVDGGPPCVNP